jgi:hypothetical protein
MRTLFRSFHKVLNVAYVAALLLSSVLAHSFEFQRMLLPRQALTIHGPENSTKEVHSRCLDLYRRTPRDGDGPSADRFSYVVPHLGRAVVRVGKQTMSLEEALIQRKIEILGSGDFQSVMFKKLVSEDVHMAVLKSVVVTEGKNDDAEELNSFFSSHEGEWNSEPSLSSIDSRTQPGRIGGAASPLQRKLWRQRSDAMREYLRSSNIDEIVRLIADQQKNYKDQTQNEISSLKELGFTKNQTQQFAQEREEDSLEVGKDLLATADYASVAAKAVERYKNNAPIVVHIFPHKRENKNLYGVAFFPDKQAILLRTTDAADQVVERRRLMKNNSPVLIIGSSDQRSDYLAFELSIRAALAEKDEAWTTQSEPGPDKLFTAFPDLPTNRGGNFNIIRNGPPPPTVVGPSPGGQPKLLAFLTRSKITITAFVRRWRIQFASASPWTASNAARFGVERLTSDEDDGDSREARVDIYNDMANFVSRSLESQFGNAHENVSIDGQYGQNEIFARRIVNNEIPTLSIVHVNLQGKKP